MTTQPEPKPASPGKDENTARPQGKEAGAAAAPAAGSPAPAKAPGAGSPLLSEGSAEDGFGNLSLVPKPADAKPAVATPATAKPAEAKPTAATPVAAKPADAKAPAEPAAVTPAAKAPTGEKPAAATPPAPKPAAPVPAAKPEAAAPKANLPTVVPKGKDLPAEAPKPPAPAAPGAADTMSEARRAEEIRAIQRDIARRRRRRMWMLFARLAAFVLIPTIVTGWYYFTQATPLYATVSQFQIQHANSAAPSAGGLGALLGGSQLATNPESVAVQSYLTSRDAMLRLDRDMGFRRAFQDPSVDLLTRLPSDATNEATFKTYKSSVKIGYDPTEGVINMEVVAPDPQLSREFSLALIEYAEEQVDQMTARLRNDQLAEARKNYDEAEAGVLDAQRRVQDLQERMGILDPMAEGGAVLTRIQTMEAELLRKRLELGTLESNPRPNAGRVDAIKGEIVRLEEMIVQTRQQLTESTDARNSLAAITGELRMAEAELATRQQLLASSLAMLEAARIEVGKQVRYLTLSVAPVAPDEATYPRAGQNTFVALLIFSGIYLMISLTVSILREQVSS